MATAMAMASCAIWASPGLVVWGLSSPVAMVYVYYGVMRLPRGFRRLLASLPVMAFYVYMGKGFATVFERGVYSFFFIWLTSFKMALLCWDDGPAADPWAVASFPRFLAIMNLSLQIKRQKFAERFRKATPRGKQATARRGLSNGTTGAGSHVVVAPRDRESSSATRRNGFQNGGVGVAGPTQRQASGGGGGGGARTELGWMAHLRAADASQETPLVVVRLLFKFVCLVLITYSYTYREAMHVGLLSMVYSFDIYVACSLIFEGIAAVVSPVMGIELEAAFNKPFLAHSLADFWGKRWNLLVSNLLRVSIYDPVLRVLLWSTLSRPDLNTKSKSSTLGLPEPSQESHVTSSASPSNIIFNESVPLWARSVAAFTCFVASGLMHELIFYNMTKSKPTWAVTFFFLINGAATILEGAVRQTTSLRLPKFVSTPLTVSFVLITAIWWFYPPLVDTGAADNAIAEFTYFFQSLNQLVRGS